ncbi:MAG: PrsW family glutamic-type intramembrane protease [Patescibacteria group bacterium]
MNKDASALLLLPLFALILPFVLWPVELFLPYPYILEEAAKGVLVFFVLQLSSRSIQFTYGFFVGLLFALSENVLYLFNIFAIGTVSFFLQRVSSTTALHIGTTFLILAVSLRDKRLIILGIFLAGVIHYLFNSFI